jgi:ribosomal protein S18 acetylase RimI-like enzyme
LETIEALARWIASSPNSAPDADVALRATRGHSARPKEIGLMDGENPIVRQAEASDAPAIAALQVRSWRAAYRGIAPDAFLDDLAEDAWLERWVERLTAAGGERIAQLVSTDAPGGSPRAVAACGPALEPTLERTGQLYVLYVDPPHWRRGHGGSLLRRVHELLAANGHTGALLWVAAENGRSIEFYENHRWTKDGGTQREDVAGVHFDEIRMVRDLAP